MSHKHDLESLRVPADDETVTPEDEAYHAEFINDPQNARERIMKRVREKTNNSLGKAKQAVQEANGYSGTVNLLEEHDKEQREHEIADLREQLGERELTPEQVELLETLEVQYTKWSEVFEHYEVPTDGMPTWEEVKNTFLPPEVLEAALHHERPTLNITPPLTRKQMIELIDTHKVSVQKADTYTYGLDEDAMWSGGKPEVPGELKWEVRVDEGVKNVAVDPAINPQTMNNRQMIKACKKKLAAQGLKPVEGARRGLSLSMYYLSEGDPLDTETFTNLSTETRDITALLSAMGWDTDQLSLAFANPGSRSVGLRVRGSAGIDQ
jgi:hypothetical protein